MSQHYQFREGYGEYSPMRQRYSLSVEDIPGAKPRVGPLTKKTAHYEEKLRDQSPIFGERQKMYEQLYSKGNYHESTNKLTSQKKHFNAHHDSEIGAYNMLKVNEQAHAHIHNVDFPRNLTTEDIPGAKPGTLQSKTVKNHDLANKIRQGKAIEDSLDKFQQQNRNSSPYSPQIRQSADYSPVRRGGNYHYQNYERRQSDSPMRITPQQIPQEETYSPSLQNTNSYSPVIQNSTESRLPSAQKYRQEEVYSPQPQPSQIQQNYQPQTNQIQQAYPIEGRRSEVPFERSSEELNYRKEAPKSRGSYQPQSQNIFMDNKSHVINNSYNPSKKDLINNLSQDIITQQAVLERKIWEAMKGRAYNIISGTPSTQHIPGYGKQTYGTSIQAMQKNTETVKRPEPGQVRAWNPSQIPSTTLTQSNVDIRKEVGGNNTAGKLNDYSETNFRYAQKPNGQEPLNGDQLYGIKALKNLSGMKLY